MTGFQQFVFFLTTAQDRLDRFFGTEKSTEPITAYIGGDLVLPGTYLVQDGALVPYEPAGAGAGATIDAVPD